MFIKNSKPSLVILAATMPQSQAKYGGKKCHVHCTDSMDSTDSMVKTRSNNNMLSGRFMPNVRCTDNTYSMDSVDTSEKNSSKSIC
jgi:hypothetical protein